MLMQERDRIDQREIFLVIATGARPIIQERQAIGIGVDDGERFQQPLCILVGFKDQLALCFGKQPRQSPPLALRGVDRRSLLAPSSMVSTRHRLRVLHRSRRRSW